MNISRSQFGALSVLLLSVASLILAGCGEETKDGPAASAAAKKSSETYVDSVSEIPSDDVAMGGMSPANDGAPRSDFTRRTTKQVIRATYELMPGEELWVIARGVEAPAQAPADRPGCGALMAKLPDAEKEVPVPLKHTAVVATSMGTSPPSM